MSDDRDMDAMMADGLLRTVRESAQGLYGEVQTYPCDDVKRMASEVDRLRRERADLLDRLNGTPCAEIRWQQERERLRAMVRSAYNEGFGQGMREHTSSRGGIPWHDSRFCHALSREKDPRDEG